MIISRAEIASAVSAYRTVKRTASATAVTVETADTFDPSDEAASLSDVFAAAIAEPFYRPHLVEKLRRRISEGRYYVSSEQIVEKLLGHMILAAA